MEIWEPLAQRWKKLPRTVCKVKPRQPGLAGEALGLVLMCSAGLAVCCGREPDE